MLVLSTCIQEKDINHTYVIESMLFTPTMMYKHMVLIVLTPSHFSHWYAMLLHVSMHKVLGFFKNQTPYSSTDPGANDAHT